jgi:hypothetical protein
VKREWADRACCTKPFGRPQLVKKSAFIRLFVSHERKSYESHFGRKEQIVPGRGTGPYDPADETGSLRREHHPDLLLLGADPGNQDRQIPETCRAGGAT